MLRRLFIKTAVIVSLVAVPLAAQAVETLRFAHYASPGDTAHKAAQLFKDRVEELSNSTLNISLHPAGELGNSPTLLQGARLGTIDIVLVGNPYFTAFAPQINLLDLPFLFQSAAHAYQVLDGQIGEHLLSSLNSSNLQGLAFWEIGFRDLTNNKRPIVTPADLAGLKLRTTPNPAHIKAFQILGANPAPMPFAEVYSALQTGTIDGQENPINHIYASKLYEVQKYLSRTAHAYTAAPLVMNRGRFARLSPAQQTALKTAALEAATYERTLNANEAAGNLQAMKDAGIQVVESPDVAAFRAAVTDETRTAYIEKFGGDLLQKIDALVTQ